MILQFNGENPKFTSKFKNRRSFFTGLLTFTFGINFVFFFKFFSQINLPLALTSNALVIDFFVPKL